MARIIQILIFLLGSFQTITSQVTLTESNLPIIVIDSKGKEIVDGGNVNADLKVYFKEDGSVNKLTDPPTHYNGNSGIKLRGQTSLFLFDKKSYSLETRNAEGKDTSVNMLLMPKESDWILHGPFSDKSLMRNALLYSLADEILAYSPRVQMVEMIVNNDYKGVYLFTEKIKRDDSRVDIANLKTEDIAGEELTGGYILKFDKSEPEEIAWTSPYSISSAQPTNFIYYEPEWDEIVSQQKVYIKNWITNFENVLAGSDFADPDNGYRKYINVESFIDHMLLCEMSRNVDAYRLSTYMYKEKDAIDDPGQLFMGPVWDFNLAFGNADYCNGSSIEGWAYDFNSNCSDDYWQIHFWWKRMLQDPNFVERLKDKWQKLRNGKFTNAKIKALIDGFESQLLVPQQRNFQRWAVLGNYVWPNNFVGATYDAEVNYLRTWLTDRLNWMDEELGIILDQEDLDFSQELLIAPNPVLDRLYLKSENLIEGSTFEIYSHSGTKMINGSLTKENEIDVRALPSGLYIIQLKGKSFKVTLKFVKM